MLTIESRQKTGVLFPVLPPETEGPFPALLAAGASETFGPFELDGYSTVAVMAVSDQPFTISILEAVVPEGPYVLTQTLASDSAGSLSRRFSPIGSYGKAVLQNTGPAAQTRISILGQGIPLP